jgi:hypothetical protein
MARWVLMAVSGGSLLMASFGLTPQDDGLSAPAPAVAITPAHLDGLESYACASCHTEVAAEWESSAHGLAWVDEAYQASLKKRRRPKSCYGCHAPEPLLASEGDGGGELRRPKPRATDQHFGVGCEACHEGPGGVVLGPRGTEVEAHPSQVSNYMSAPGSDALCAACHATNIGPVIGVAKDFQARSDKGGLSCVACHMAPVTRRWADGDDVPERTGRSHALQTPRDPAFLRRAFRVSWRSDGGRSRVVIANEAGHRVPGLVGRVITFEASVVDGEEVIETVSLTIDVEAYLPAERSIEIRLDGLVGKAGADARVQLVGTHVDPRSDATVEFLNETLLSGSD